jgi:hypothetical protein
MQLMQCNKCFVLSLRCRTSINRGYSGNHQVSIQQYAQLDADTYTNGSLQNEQFRYTSLGAKSDQQGYSDKRVNTTVCVCID